MPDALVYPEYIGSEFLYPFDESLVESNGEDTNCTGILQRLKNWQTMLANNDVLPKLSLDDFSQKTLRPKYAELLNRLAREINK